MPTLQEFVETVRHDAASGDPLDPPGAASAAPASRCAGSGPGRGPLPRSSATAHIADKLAAIRAGAGA